MVTFTLTLDDFSPHQHAGLDFKVIERCQELIKHFPELKVNLFVPAAYCRLGQNPCFLSNFPEWVAKVNALPNNFRINIHGYYHRRYSQKYGNSNNDEWQYLTQSQAKIVGEHMLGEFKKSGLKYKSTFRPPAWKISKEAIQALQQLGIKCFAGNKEYYEEVKSVLKVKWINYNWDMLAAVPNDDIIVFGHTSDWTKNYLDDDMCEKILNILNKKIYEFKFIEEL